MSHQLTFADSEFSSKRRQTGLVDQIQSRILAPQPAGRA